MEVMSMLLFLLVLVFFICLIIGLIKPSIFSRFLGGEVTRKKTTKIFTIASVFSFVLFFIAAVNIPETEKQKSKSEPTAENTSNRVSQRNSDEKPPIMRELPQQDTSPKPDKIEKTQGVSVQPTPGSMSSTSQIYQENQTWETRHLPWFTGRYKFKGGVAKYELVFEREDPKRMMNRSHKDWKEMESCASEKISSIIYRLTQDKSVERIELTCFLEKENLTDKYGNRVESNNVLMGTLVRNKTEIDDIRKYVNENYYVKDRVADLLGTIVIADHKGNLTNLSSTGSIKCP